VGRTALLLLVEDIAGVDIAGLPARVPDALLHRRHLDAVMHRGCFCPTAMRSTTTLPLSAGGVGTEASRSCCVVPPAFAEAAERIRDTELSACCTAAALRRACASLRRLRPLGVEGSGIAQSRIAVAVSFWLALSKASGFSTPSSTRVRSRAMRPASRATAPWPERSFLA
jgi:hypothetical protein